MQLLTDSVVGALCLVPASNIGQNTFRKSVFMAHQPSLASCPRTYLAVMTYRISVLPTVMFHPRFRHHTQTTAAVFYLTSFGRSAGSSLYSRQAGVSGFRCHRLERPASPRRICAVSRGFQTTPSRPFCFPVRLFLPRHYHMTRVLLLTFITAVWTPMVLAIICII